MYRGTLTETEFEQAFASLLESGRKTGVLPDAVFNKVGKLLADLGKREWSLRPRTYTVLRMIHRADCMDEFVTHGLLDFHIPYCNVASLPPGLSESSRHKFISYQEAVLTAARDIEDVEDGRHRHFNCDADCYFHVRRVLGKGKFGIVDLVESRLSLEEFARKRLLKSSTFKRRKDAIRAFENELQNLKRLSHRHLVRFVGSYTDRKYIAILMTPVADCDLHQYLTRDPFPPNEFSILRSFFGCLCNAVKYLHESKCRHKDIKPVNILVKNHEVYLTDFGTARDWSELTRGTTSGPTGPYTPRYAAPEVIDEEDRNALSDIWSLGCVYLEILCVLKGYTVRHMREFFAQTGTTRAYVSCNSQALDMWLHQLEKRETDNAPLNWIRQMLNRSRLDRPSAYDLFDTILSHEDELVYYGPCCSAEEPSDVDSSYQGSVIDQDDYGDATCVNGHPSSALPLDTVKCPSETSGALEDILGHTGSSLSDAVHEETKLAIADRSYRHGEDLPDQDRLHEEMSNTGNMPEKFAEHSSGISSAADGRGNPPTQKRSNDRFTHKTSQWRQHNGRSTTRGPPGLQSTPPDMNETDDASPDTVPQNLSLVPVESPEQTIVDDGSEIVEDTRVIIDGVPVKLAPQHRKKKQIKVVFIRPRGSSGEPDEDNQDDYESISSQRRRHAVQTRTSRSGDKSYDSSTETVPDMRSQGRAHRSQGRRHANTESRWRQPQRTRTEPQAHPRSSEDEVPGRRHPTSGAEYSDTYRHNHASNHFHPNFLGDPYPQMNQPQYPEFYEGGRIPLYSAPPFDPWEQYAYYFTDGAPDFKVVKHEVLQNVYQYMGGFTIFQYTPRKLTSGARVILNDGYGFNQIVCCDLYGRPLEGPLPFADRKIYAYPRENPFAYGNVQPRIKTFLVSEFSSKKSEVDLRGS